MEFNGWAEPIGSNIFSSGEALGLVHIDHSLVKLMKRPSKPNRRRFFLNSGILAAAWELSCVDAALAQEIAATPPCHDGDEPTASETEGQRSTSAARGTITLRFRRQAAVY